MLEKRYREYLNLAKKITKGDERYVDLLHDVLIQLQTNDRWNNIHTKEEQMYFLSRAITNQFYSNNSGFYKTYRKFNSIVYDLPDQADTEYQDRPSIEWIQKTLKNELETNPSSWYNVGLFQLYLEHKKIEPIHKKTRIPRYSIRETINHMKKWIRLKWDEQWEK